MDVLRLRPHHINCLFFYEGKGYNQSFIDNMDAIVTRLKSFPDQLIVLEKNHDSLCHCCPNRENGVCTSADSVEIMDAYTLLHYKLKEHQLYRFQEIMDTIYKHYSFDTFSAICSECSWYKQGVCSQEKIRTQQQTWLT